MEKERNEKKKKKERKQGCRTNSGRWRCRCDSEIRKTHLRQGLFEDWLPSNLSHQLVWHVGLLKDIVVLVILTVHTNTERKDLLKKSLVFVAARHAA